MGRGQTLARYIELDLASGPVKSSEERRLRHMLAAGPWCWPEEGSVGERRGLSLVPQRPLEPLPGVALLVAVEKGTQASLLVVGAEAVLAEEGAAFSTSLGKEAVDAWHDARAALPRSLPFLWRDLEQNVGQEPFRVYRLNGVLFSSTEADRFSPSALRLGRTGISHVDGRSFGLAFGLSLASSILSLPLPFDVVALACLNVEGAVTKVKGLEEKFACLLSCAPQIQQVLVAEEQAEEACELAQTLRSDGKRLLEIHPVSHLSAALDRLWGSQLEQHLIEQAGEEDSREEICRSLFELALRATRNAAFDWHPVLRTAELLLQQRTLSLSEQRETLFVKAVALRYVRQKSLSAEEYSYMEALLEEEPLQDLPLPHRIVVAAQFVQQATDTGVPPVERAQEIAAPYRVPWGESFPEHLKLQGALARLYAVTGKAQEALSLQQEVAESWLRLHVYDVYDDISYPLTEWFRLAGVLRKRETLEKADRFWRRVSLLCGLSEADPRPHYIELARAKAQLLFEQEATSPSTEKLAALCQTLEELRDDALAHDDLRWSAERWRLRATALLSQTTASALQNNQSSGRKSCLQEEAPLSLRETPSASFYRALIELDRAVETGDSLRAEAVLAEVGRLQAQPLGLLQESFTKEAGRRADPLKRAAYLARYYPY